MPLPTERTLQPSRQPPSRTQHFEHVHTNDKWRLDMATETNLGLVAKNWSVTSKMDDPRPNGRALFDARFVHTPMGRARAGRSLAWDPRGTMNAGGAKAFENIDIVQKMAAQNASRVAAGTKSAQFAEYHDGVKLSENGTSETDYMLAQMSKLQKRQMDKDGDGKLSQAELRAQGFVVGGP